MAQYTVDLPCLGDTYNHSLNPNNNYSAEPALKALSAYPDTKTIFLKFDLSTIPLNKKILSANLKIYFQGFGGGGTFGNVQIFVHSCDDEVFENQITANSTIHSLTTTKSHGKKNFGIVAQDINTYIDRLALIDQISSAHAQNRNNLWLTFESSITGDGYEQTYASKESALNKPPYLVIVYEDTPPNVPTPIRPIGDYKDGKSVICFEWEYNSDVGGTQKAFDLQWSIDQVNWTTISQTTANNYYEMPADTLPGGNVYWRVRCYNEYDEVGEYCLAQSFYAVGAPTIPAISAVTDTMSRPTISWSAFYQQVYQLQIMRDDSIVYDSGDRPSINVRQYKVTAFLTDATYTARMRIKNEYDLWSAWSETTFTLSTVKPDKPSIAIQTSAYGIELNFSTSPTDGYTLIYRSEYNKSNYICIGKTTATAYQDNAVCNNAEYKYFVRAVAADETYEDSDVKFIQASFRHSLIAPVSDLTNVFAFKWNLNSPPKRVYNRNINSASVYYAGRMYPVDEPTEHIAAGMSFTYFLKTWADVERFIEIYDLKSTVLYRDAKGRKIYGTLSNLSVTDEHFGYTVSFVISQTDYNESVEV